MKYERELWSIFAFFLFWGPYLLINYLTIFRTTHDLTLTIDQIIPFLPFFIIFYITDYFLVAMPYFLIKNIEKFRKVILVYVITLITGYLIFLIYPVKITRPEITGSGFFPELLALIYGIDYPYNCFPSLHVAMSFLSAFVCYHEHKKYGWLFLWASLIAISTLFIKQHYALDVIGGIILSIITYQFFFKKISY